MNRFSSEMTQAHLWLESTKWRPSDQLEATLLNQGRDNVVETKVVRFEQFTEIFRGKRSSLELRP